MRPKQKKSSDHCCLKSQNVRVQEPVIVPQPPIDPHERVGEPTYPASALHTPVAVSPAFVVGHAALTSLRASHVICTHGLVISPNEPSARHGRVGLPRKPVRQVP